MRRFAIAFTLWGLIDGMFCAATLATAGDEAEVYIKGSSGILVKES